MKKTLLRKNDIYLIGILLIIFLLILGGVKLTQKGGTEVVVSIDGAEAYSFPIDEDLEFEITGYDGGTNLLIIENGYAYLKEASCPDKLCVHMGRINKDGQSIICLPNRVVVEIRSAGKIKSEDDYDTVVG